MNPDFSLSDWMKNWGTLTLFEHLKLIGCKIGNGISRARSPATHPWVVLAKANGRERGHDKCRNLYGSKQFAHHCLNLLDY
jgi:hypothetical protein